MLDACREHLEQVELKITDQCLISRITRCLVSLAGAATTTRSGETRPAPPSHVLAPALVSAVRVRRTLAQVSCRHVWWKWTRVGGRHKKTSGK